MKLRQAPRQIHRAGFTLIEVVLAMFILLIGMSSLLALFTFGAALSRTASLRSASANAIEAVVADLEETLFPLVIVDGAEVAGEPIAIVDEPVPGHDGLVYSVRSTPNPEDERDPPLEYLVEVEISWQASGKRRKRSFSTILLRQVPFGARLRQRFVEGLEPSLVPGPEGPSEQQP